MSKAKRKKYLVIPGNGDPCPRCCQPTEIREHEAILEKHRRQPFYFRKWFHCTNPQCVAQMICPERYKVWNIDGEKRTSLEQWLAQFHANRRKEVA